MPETMDPDDMTAFSSENVPSDMAPTAKAATKVTAKTPTLFIVMIVVVVVVILVLVVLGKVDGLVNRIDWHRIVAFVLTRAGGGRL